MTYPQPQPTHEDCSSPPPANTHTNTFYAAACMTNWCTLVECVQNDAVGVSEALFGRSLAHLSMLSMVSTSNVPVKITRVHTAPSVHACA
jgi:hypothetical protein